MYKYCIYECNIEFIEVFGLGFWFSILLKFLFWSWCEMNKWIECKYLVNYFISVCRLISFLINGKFFEGF